MSEQRLSKLQKWILAKCYQEQNSRVFTAMRKEDVFRFFKNTYFIGSQKFVIPKRFKAFMTPAEYNRAHATISRSLRGLRNKGFVKLVGHKKIEQPNFENATALATKYKTQEELQTAMKEMDPAELIKMTNSFTKTEDVAVEIENDNNTTKTKIVVLTEKGIQKAKELLRLSS